MIQTGAWVIALQLASTLYMVGVIWFVQLVHYPLMGCVPGGHFVAYHRWHTVRTGGAVIGPMLIEGVTAGLLLWPGVDSVPASIAAAGLVLLAIVWASTFGIQVPLHRRLEGGFDVDAHRRLVSSNWLRTVVWTMRGVIVIMMVVAVG